MLAIFSRQHGNRWLSAGRIMSNYVNQAMHVVNTLSMWDWFAILLVVVTIGFFCMRGFGSRSNY